MVKKSCVIHSCKLQKIVNQFSQLILIFDFTTMRNYSFFIHFILNDMSPHNLHSCMFFLQRVNYYIVNSFSPPSSIRHHSDIVLAFGRNRPRLGHEIKVDMTSLLRNFRQTTFIITSAVSGRSQMPAVCGAVRIFRYVWQVVVH